MFFLILVRKGYLNKEKQNVSIITPSFITGSTRRLTACKSKVGVRLSCISTYHNHVSWGMYSIVSNKSGWGSLG